MREATTGTLNRIAVGVGVAAACVLLAPATDAQMSTVRLDPDVTRKRFRALTAELGERVENRARPIVVEKTAAASRLDLSVLRSRPGFLEGHLLPRMSRQVADVSSIHTLETQRGRFEDSSLHDWVADTVGHRALSATRRAAKAYLYEVTPIGSWLESRPVGRRAAVGGPSARFKVDVSHGVPRLGLRHRAATGATRLDIGLDGTVRLEFRPTGSTSARFYAGYVADDSAYVLSYRVGF